LESRLVVFNKIDAANLQNLLYELERFKGKRTPVNTFDRSTKARSLS